ncbi:hypothetical protein GQ457_10G016100 [Hibiscus cannabinus]
MDTTSTVSFEAASPPIIHCHGLTDNKSLPWSKSIWARNSFFHTQSVVEIPQFFGSSTTSGDFKVALTTHEDRLSFANIANTSQFTTWIVDSGASTHMTGNLSLFQNFRNSSSQAHVKTADGTLSSVEGSGSIQLTEHICLHSVLYVPKLTCNLLFVSKLVEIFVLI